MNDAPKHYRLIVRFTEEATIKEKQELLTIYKMVAFMDTNLEWRQMLLDIPNSGQMWSADLEGIIDNKIVEEVIDPVTKDPLDHPRW